MHLLMSLEVLRFCPRDLLATILYEWGKASLICDLNVKGLGQGQMR